MSVEINVMSMVVSLVVSSPAVDYNVSPTFSDINFEGGHQTIRADICLFVGINFGGVDIPFLVKSILVAIGLGMPVTISVELAAAVEIPGTTVLA